MSDDPVKTNRPLVDWSRREVLGLLGTAAGAAALTGCTPASGEGARDAAGPAQALDCVVTPAQTEGPYFVDERLERRDIRLDPKTKAVKEGVPLRLRIHVSRVDGGACAPLAGAIVDVWQCDALGAYSDVWDHNGDTRGQKFLRGYQVTDRSGTAEFVTIYPGWYARRAVHIHFKVRHPAGGKRSHELTSQLYFDDAVTDRVHALPPYNAKGARDTRNDLDGIFRASDSGSELLLRLSRNGPGSVGDINVGLRMS
ncbi:MAG TPA: intradiol ring-cleavage dioxygenase [Thermoanaerobaculia bacterium]|nr:intradiol ring-cleavage dioxygenase [Thermoanaerobaculia bacterium]